MQSYHQPIWNSSPSPLSSPSCSFPCALWVVSDKRRGVRGLRMDERGKGGKRDGKQFVCVKDQPHTETYMEGGKQSRQVHKPDRMTRQRAEQTTGPPAPLLSLSFWTPFV